MDVALEKAQETIDSLIDIRPEYAGKRVTKVEIISAPNTVAITLDSDLPFNLTGLFARIIIDAGHA